MPVLKSIIFHRRRLRPRGHKQSDYLKCSTLAFRELSESFWGVFYGNYPDQAQTSVAPHFLRKKQNEND